MGYAIIKNETVAKVTFYAFIPIGIKNSVVFYLTIYQASISSVY